MKLILIAILSTLIHIQVKSQENDLKHLIVNDTTNTYKSFEQILELDRFKNKVVCINFWGTACGFCLAEFKHENELKLQFENDSVEFVYLCTRYPNTKKNEKRWEEIIYENKLDGTHILLSNECYESFIDNYEDKYPPILKAALPKYLLVNKNGEIINFNLPRPSTKELIYTEIRKEL